MRADVAAGRGRPAESAWIAGRILDRELFRGTVDSLVHHGGEGKPLVIVRAVWRWLARLAEQPRRPGVTLNGLPVEVTCDCTPAGPSRRTTPSPGWRRPHPAPLVGLLAAGRHPRRDARARGVGIPCVSALTGPTAPRHARRRETAKTTGPSDLHETRPYPA